MFRINLLLILLILSVKSFAQRDTIALNTDWQFRTDEKSVGLNEKWYKSKLEGGRLVQLPHTWNVEDRTQNYYGWAWYQKVIDVPMNWKNKNVVLRFAAINHTSKIYVNGSEVAEQIGDGFNGIFVSLNGKVIYGKKNVITVFCNNDYGKNKVPFADSFDWANDGGIIRTASLIVSGKPAASYIQAVTKLDNINAVGFLNLKLGFDQYFKGMELDVRIFEENQLTKNQVLNQVVTPHWQGHQAQMEFKLDHVNAWHFDFPNLYRIEVNVVFSGKVVDKISTIIGFRDIRMIDNQFYLNGAHVKLMGVEWTAGSNPNFGFAEPASEILRQGKLMKDVNAIFTRQHFQQDELFYDFCDRNGILVQQELPLWGPETPSDAGIEKIAQEQLNRMIKANYNHPSIFAWGVGNELNGRKVEMKQMIQKLIDTARKLDPNRNVAYVSNTLTQGFIGKPGFTPDAGSLGDYIMMNEYGGSWWNIPTGQIHSYLDSIHFSYPDKTFFISEFGLCEPNFKGGDERRIEDLIYHMAIYESKTYVEGAIYFDLTDYRTHYPGTSENNKYRRRIHGIYDVFGKPKQSMKVLRELSSPVDVQGLQNTKKGKKSIVIFGSMGLPQHLVKGYKVYLSKSTDDYLSSKGYNLPDLLPGGRINLEIDDLNDDAAIVTVVRPNGYIASQKSFY